jgi:hypothetical protein
MWSADKTIVCCSSLLRPSRLQDIRSSGRDIVGDIFTILARRRAAAPAGSCPYDGALPRRFG